MRFVKFFGRCFVSFLVASFICGFLMVPVESMGLNVEEPMLLVFVVTIGVYYVIAKMSKTNEKAKKAHDDIVRKEIIDQLVSKQHENERKAKDILNIYENTPEYVRYKEAIDKALDTIEKHNCNMVVIGEKTYDDDPTDGESRIYSDEGIYFATVNSSRTTVYNSFIPISRPNSIPKDTLENGSIKALLLENRYPKKFIYGRPQSIKIDYWNSISSINCLLFMTPGLLELYIKDYNKDDLETKVKELEKKRKAEEQYKRERSSNIPM